MLIYFSIQLPIDIKVFIDINNYCVLNLALLLSKLLHMLLYSLRTWTILIIKLKHLHTVAELNSVRELPPKCPDTVPVIWEICVLPFTLNQPSETDLLTKEKPKQNRCSFHFERRYPIVRGNFSTSVLTSCYFSFNLYQFLPNFLCLRGFCLWCVKIHTGGEENAEGCPALPFRVSLSSSSTLRCHGFRLDFVSRPRLSVILN